MMISSRKKYTDNLSTWKTNKISQNKKYENTEKSNQSESKVDKIPH